jgi:tetratricopeptide (TPR) repeat protein
MCLQQLGDHKAALKEHRAALRIARSLQATDIVENCLNNLGEALRKTGRSAEAVPLFVEAEAIARGRGDEESEISVAHNRALALEDLSQHSRAAAVLLRCRDAARRLECWDQFVRALHGLANHAWRTSKPDEAEGLYCEAFAAAKHHRVPEQRVMVAINYANALRVRGQPKKACRLLLGVRGAIFTAPDAWEYHFALAAAATEAGESSVAIAAYEAAGGAARAAGAMEEAVQGAAALAECLAEAGQFARAGDVIATTLSSETAGRRKVPLLTARLKLLLRTGKRPQAGRVFTQATRLAEAEGMKEELVDLHMVLGDHDWQGGKSKLEALKAYTAALPPACNISFEVMIQTGAHVVRQLLNLPEGERASRIEGFLAKLKSWLAGQVPKKQYADAERAILWPVRVALRVVQTGQDLSAIPARTLTGYVTEELLGTA